MGLHINEVKYDEIEEYGKKEGLKIFNNSFYEINDIYEKNYEKILHEILSSIESCLVQTKNHQITSGKGKLQNINIFFMNYYYYTRKDPILIYAFDDRYYLDKSECFASLQFEQIFMHYQEDVNKMYKMFSKKYLRAPNELIEKYMKKYLLDYFNIVAGILQENIDKIENLIRNYDCSKEEDVIITIGGYMDKELVIGRVNTEE